MMIQGNIFARNLLYNHTHMKQTTYLLTLEKYVLQEGSAADFWNFLQSFILLFRLESLGVFSMHNTKVYKFNMNLLSSEERFCCTNTELLHVIFTPSLAKWDIAGARQE